MRSMRSMRSTMRSTMRLICCEHRICPSGAIAAPRDISAIIHTTGQPQANHRPTTSQPQANHKPTTSRMKDLFDLLGDDVLLVIFELLRDYCPFTSLVCLRFCKIVTEVHFPYPRRASVGILMESERAIECYKRDRRVFNLLQEPRSGGSLVVWGNLARAMVVRHGSISMIHEVLGTLSLACALQSGRVDLLEAEAIKQPDSHEWNSDEWTQNGHMPLYDRVFLEQRASLRFFAAACDHSECVSAYDVHRHCINTLIPACKAPSSVSIKWIKSKVGAARLSTTSNWALIWSEFGDVSRRFVVSAAEYGTEGTLDCIFGLFLENSPREKVLVFEGMCVCIMSSPTLSLGAWGWLRKHIVSRGETLYSVLHRFLTAIRNKEPTHATFSYISILISLGHFGVRTFAVGDVQSYHIVVEGLQPNGWLRRAFFDACGHGSNFTSMCLFYNTNMSKPPRFKSNAAEFETLVVQCTKDMAED